jgi:hypothetical protein
VKPVEREVNALHLPAEDPVARAQVSCAFLLLVHYFKAKIQIPPTPFVEGGDLMDPSFLKRGWGDLQLNVLANHSYVQTLTRRI